MCTHRAFRTTFCAYEISEYWYRVAVEMFENLDKSYGSPAYICHTYQLVLNHSITVTMKRAEVQILGVALRDHASRKKGWHAYARFLHIVKNGQRRIASDTMWIFATEWLQKNPHKYFDLRCLLSM